MNKSDLSRDAYMLKGRLAKRGYDWWWHSFTGVNPLTKEERTFFVEFYVINPALSPKEVVLGQDPKNQAEHHKPSYAMLNVGTWGSQKCQLHRFFPVADCHFSKTKLDVHFGDCFLTEKAMKGEVHVTPEEAKNPGMMSDAGSLSFDLQIEKKIAFNVGYGAAKGFRDLDAFEMFWHAEGMKSEYTGTVIFNGTTYEVRPKTSYGYADKNWGSDYTSPWVWFSSCCLTSALSGKTLDHSVFDIGGGRPKAFGIPLERKLLIDLNLEGKDYEYNFSKTWTRSRIQFDCHEGPDKIIWDIKAKNRGSRMEFHGECLKKDMIFVHYENPDGEMKHHHLWNGGTGTGEIKLFDHEGNLIEHLRFSHGGCEYGEYDK